MATPNPDRWLIEEARRRFREVIRAAMREARSLLPGMARI